MTDDDPPTKQVRRERYHKVLATVVENTGDPQRVVAGANSLWTTAVSNGSLDGDVAQKALQAAVDHGDAIRWRDPEGVVRYAATVSGVESVPHLSLPVYDDADAEALREVIDTEVSRDGETDTDVVAWANQHLATLEEN